MRLKHPLTVDYPMIIISCLCCREIRVALGYWILLGLLEACVCFKVEVILDPKLTLFGIQ